MVLKDGLALVGLGAGIGLAPSLLVTQPLAMFLAAGVGPSDPISYAGVIVAMVVGLAACLLPVRRAMRVDPVVALRYE